MSRARQRHRHSRRDAAARVRHVRAGRPRAQRAQGGLGIGLTLVRTPGRDARRHASRPAATGRAAAASSSCGCRSASSARSRRERGDAGRPRAALASHAHPGGRRQPRRRREPRRCCCEILGADVHDRHDGPTALDALEAFRPAVVLLDIGMPGMDGYEVARRAAQRADGRDADADRADRLGPGGGPPRARARPASTTTSSSRSISTSSASCSRRSRPRGEPPARAVERLRG